MKKLVLLGALALSAIAVLVAPTNGLANHDPPIGELRNWVAVDYQLGVYYVKQFQLRGKSAHMELWVAKGYQGVGGRNRAQDLEFLENHRARGRGYDCRNDDPARSTITDEQVNYFLDQFERVMYPIESRVFSVPPARNGSRATLRPPTFHPTGDGNRIVTLVDNIRDSSFYDYNREKGILTGVGGFFSSTINNFFDRNVMTNEGFNWLGTTTATPPSNPNPNNLCLSFTGSPYGIEGTFAHEYQHLLEEYEDPDEVSWVNEGLSDYAEWITNYSRPALRPTSFGFDSHIQSYLGWLNVQTTYNPFPRRGGPENSLTLWGDQGGGLGGAGSPDEILSDYGQAYALMLYMESRFGQQFLTDWHRDDLQGLPGFQAVLNKHSGGQALDVIHQFHAAVALDAALDAGATLNGGSAANYQIKPMNAAINWDSPDTYDTPGAPPNGGDFVRLRGADGKYLSAGQLSSLSFKGSATLPSKEVASWLVSTAFPASTSDPALYSGSHDDLDESIIRQVTVPAANPNLTFRANYNIEDGWDYAFVQVSTDGGETYKSLTCTSSTNRMSPDAPNGGVWAKIRANHPGYTGDSGGWKNESCSMAAYAGQTVLLAFRYITDPAAEGETARIPAGIFIDDISVGGTQIESSLTGWRSATQVRPHRVQGFTVQLIAYSSAGGGPAWVGRLTLDSNFSATLDAAALRALVGSGADVVAAIVTYDESTENVDQYAPYTLTVNGAVQPGGSGSAAGSGTAAASAESPGPARVAPSASHDEEIGEALAGGKGFRRR